jgi:hypothetical protein
MAVSSVSPYCDLHRKRVERFGHPDGRALSPKRDFGVELELISAFLTKHREHEGAVAALRWLQRWLDAASMGEEIAGRTEMQRLQLHGAQPLQILTVAAALFLLSRWRPKTLPDDDRLTWQIGYQVCCLAPRNRRYSVSRGKGRMVSMTIGKVPRREIGRRIRFNLSALLVNISEAIIAEDAEQKKFQSAIRRPFSTEAKPI